MSYRTVLLCMGLVMGMAGFSQEEDSSWEALTKNYNFPPWYTQAKLGIWVHWGAQTQPESGGGWYARHMYMQDVGREIWGKNAYANQVKNYGHPSEKGFKDVINEWKAERLDTDSLLKYFKGIGAKYFVALANHHDHFDNFNSTYQPWNSVNIGPKRDIIGEFAASSRKYDIPFGLSSHDDRYLNWWLPAFGSDKTGPKKGIPYDGNMTKADGKGKWWEGLDPADLYGLPPEKRTPEWIEGVKENWLKRHTELITKYDVDMLWFDGYGFPYKEYGKELCRRFFAQDLKENNGFTKVIAAKIPKEPAIAKDIERGGAHKILPKPWQGTLTFGSWFYKKDRPLRHNVRTLVEILTDYISKNGNLLLNVELLPDGTIPDGHKGILDAFGTWVNLNQEAIFSSKPWKVYGDNLGSIYRMSAGKNTDETDLAALDKVAEEENFNERTIESPLYGPEEVRFTTKGDILYIFALNPKAGLISLPSLGFGSPQRPGKIQSMALLGSDKKIEFVQDNESLGFKVPEKRPNHYALVFKVKGALHD